METELREIERMWSRLLAIVSFGSASLEQCNIENDIEITCGLEEAKVYFKSSCQFDAATHVIMLQEKCRVETSQLSNYELDLYKLDGECYQYDSSASIFSTTLTVTHETDHGTVQVYRSVNVSCPIPTTIKVTPAVVNAVDNFVTYQDFLDSPKYSMRFFGESDLVSSNTFYPGQRMMGIVQCSIDAFFKVTFKSCSFMGNEVIKDHVSLSPELVKLVPSQTIPDGFSYVSNVPVFAAFEFLAFNLEDALEGSVNCEMDVTLHQ